MCCKCKWTWEDTKEAVECLAILAIASIFATPFVAIIGAIVLRIIGKE